jgi:ribonuclease HI
MHIEIHTSGKVEPRNTMHGGWSVVLVAIDDSGNEFKRKVLANYQHGATAYECQAIAILRGLEALIAPQDAPIVVYSRNETLVKVIDGDNTPSKHADVIANIRDLMAKIQSVNVLFVDKQSMASMPYMSEADGFALQACYDGAKENNA